MQIQDLLLLYDYNYWANDRILSATASLSPEQFAARAAPGQRSLRGTLVHTLDAEYGWRMMCQQGTFAPDLAEEEFPAVDALIDRWHAEETAMRAYLAGLGDGALAGPVRYTTSGGLKRERVLWHCLLHVVNHGTQHRAEAAAILTGYGQSPGDVDFTLFLSERVKLPTNPIIIHGALLL